jgi:hypothetical protein
VRDVVWFQLFDFTIFLVASLIAHIVSEYLCHGFSFGSAHRGCLDPPGSVFLIRDLLKTRSTFAI